jgi:alpha-tubulin suppressor-like RCC1 family protein
MHAYARLVLPALVVALAACGEDSEPTTGPSAGEMATTEAGRRAPGNWFQVSAGNAHTCGVTTDDRAFCWGFGLLGNGASNSLQLTPTPVAGNHAFTQVSAGIDHTCGVTASRQAFCWGGNSTGQLGDGSTTDRTTPVLVAGGLRFRSVDAGSFHTCGVSYPDNSVYCWGSNALGKLGDGTTAQREQPVEVLGNHKFRRVSAGWDHTCGVTTDDRALCWGRNREGAVGDGSDVNRRQRPVAVAGGHDFRQVDAGLDYTCGVTTTNDTYCWGDGSWGQLGNGGTSGTRSPVAVAGSVRFDRVSAGAFHACAETTENRVYCWGHNLFGSLGDGTTTQRNTPVGVTGGLAFGQISAGSFFTCGVAANDNAFCWGDNGNGQLGDGTQQGRTAPGQVAGAT